LIDGEEVGFHTFVSLSHLTSHELSLLKSLKRMYSTY